MCHPWPQCENVTNFSHIEAHFKHCLGWTAHKQGETSKKYLNAIEYRCHPWPCLWGILCKAYPSLEQNGLSRKERWKTESIRGRKEEYKCGLESLNWEVKTEKSPFEWLPSRSSITWNSLSLSLAHTHTHITLSISCLMSIGSLSNTSNKDWQLEREREREKWTNSATQYAKEIQLTYIMAMTVFY